MLDRLTGSLDFHGNALLLRAERTRLLAGNIANADTPNFKARDFDFRAALAHAAGVAPDAKSTAAPARMAQAQTVAGHLPGAGPAAGGPTVLYRAPLQTALDGNTVDMDMERASFAENTLRYEAGLRFINGQIRTMLTAITGQ